MLEIDKPLTLIPITHTTNVLHRANATVVLMSDVGDVKALKVGIKPNSFPTKINKKNVNNKELTIGQ